MSTWSAAVVVAAVVGRDCDGSLGSETGTGCVTRDKVAESRSTTNTDCIWIYMRLSV